MEQTQPRAVNIKEEAVTLIRKIRSNTMTISKPSLIRVEIPPLFSNKDLTVKNKYCNDWIKDPFKVKAPMLQGQTGTGKTHAMYGMLKNLANKFNDHNDTLYYGFVADNKDSYDTPKPEFVNITLNLLTSVRIIHDIRNGIAKNQSDDIIRNYQKIDILFIDDFGVEQQGEYSNEIFYLIFDYRLQYCKPTVIASNLDNKEISNKYGERIISRLFEMCHLIELTGEDKRIYK